MLKLKDIKVFEGVSDQAIDWFEETADRRTVEKGETILMEGDLIEHMQVVLEGKMQFYLKQGETLRPNATVEAGQLSGLLPFSRLKNATGRVVVQEDCTLLLLHKSHFQKLGEVSPELMQNLVGYLSDRVRNFTRSQQQQEKMASLGKLSAGLAHEINNPASAIGRTSGAIREKIQAIPVFTTRLMNHQLSGQQLDAVVQLVTAKCNLDSKPTLSMLEKGEWEDSLIDWMDDREVDNSFEYAEVLMGAGLRVEDLDQMAEAIPEQAIPDALAWINATIEAEKLSVEIHEASERISNLVGSIKTYSHMDRSPDREPTQIHDGLDSTLNILTHKIKNTQIVVHKDYQEDLAQVNAYAGELNQVWTNLIDNAIDALGDDGNVTIRTFNQDEFVRIDIQDDGPGIPDEIQQKIFDPFFTTKGVGEGSGLGLDIVNRIIQNHNGSIKVKSEPGNTVFEVCIPRV